MLFLFLCLSLPLSLPLPSNDSSQGPVAWVFWVRDKYPILVLAIQSDNWQPSDENFLASPPAVKRDRPHQSHGPRTTPISTTQNLQRSLRTGVNWFQSNWKQFIIVYPDLIPNIEARLGVFLKSSTPNTLDFCQCPPGQSLSCPNSWRSSPHPEWTLMWQWDVEPRRKYLLVNSCAHYLLYGSIC